MARVYLDTSFVSACITTRTDPASLVRRATSTEWMATQAARHHIFISTEVVNELDNPKYPSRSEALAFVDPLSSVEITDEVLGLAAVFVGEKLMPAPVGGDAVHVAACCIHRLEYLLSWNVRHLANPNKISHLRSICTRLGKIPPTIVTPDLLWEDEL
jgi:hypothetical protein